MTQILPTRAPEGTSTAMAAGLERLWVKFLPEIEQRLAMLEAAADTLAIEALPDQQRDEAHAAAHKLAGILGTFGLHHGTELARQVELLTVDRIAEADSQKFSNLVAELREVVNARQAPS